MATYLGLVDFPSIKKWVFGTDRAREIRGASALLDQLNRRELPGRLTEGLGRQCRVVFAGGGAAMFVTEASNESEVEGLLRGFSIEVERRTGGGLGLEWVVVKQERSFQETVTRAHLLLGARRGLSEAVSATRGLGMLRACDSCSQPGVSGTWRDPEGDVDWLCATCRVKRNHRREGETWADLVKALGLDGEPERYRPDDLGALGELCCRSGYVGLLYFDGDSMGNVVRQVESERQLRQFSDLVYGCLRQALVNSLRSLGADDEARRSGTLPCDVFLLGGDDLVMATPADLALPLALKVTTCFKELTENKSQQLGLKLLSGGLSVSAGVAVAKSRQPFRIVLEQAECLLASAKRERRRRASSDPFIDFADVSQTRFVDLDDLRRRELGVGSSRELTLWPMSSAEADIFWSSVVGLVRGGVSRSRLKGLAIAVASARSVAFETMRIVARSKDDRELLLGFFSDNGMTPHIPWREEEDRARTGVLDLATLHPFVREKDPLHE
jgi:hypothetical protein